MSRSRSSLFRLGMHLVLAVTLAAGLLGVPGPAGSARAATGEFVFKGRGYGHGVGMSQWGAWQAAREGKDFKFILGFYYPGTDLVPLGDPGMELKVKLSSEPWKDVSTITQNFTQVSLHAVGQPYTLVLTGPAGESSEPVPAGAWADITLKDGKVHVFTAVGGHRDGLERVEARPASADRVRIQLRSDDSVYPSREYWGSTRVEPSPTGGYLAVFNRVPIERYLRSIAEVEYDWAQASSPNYAFEAVKAQAVAARTYAVANKDPYLNDNQWDQVYLGYTGRSQAGEAPFELKYPGIPQAAEQTAGLVLRYQGAVISSFFSSSSGGFTSAWDPGRYPYLPAKPDPYSLKAPVSNPGYSWSFTVSAANLSDAVDGMSDVEGRAVDVGAVAKVEVASRDTPDPGSHAGTIRLTGDRGSAVVSASSFRRLFGYSRMRSTLISEIVNPVGTPPPPPGEFSDVPPGHIYKAEIERAVDEGLVGGYPSGEFKPDDPVSRWQFAKMAVGLHNALLPADPIPLVDVQGQPFWDVAVRPGVLGDESDWVAAAKGAGLVNGITDTNFRPYEPVRRDQMASMLVRALGWEDVAAALPPDAASFADVPVSSLHRAAATYLKSLGVLQGYEGPPGSGVYALHPDEPTKRMHVAVILSRILDLPQ
ncbi:MAG: SpoIID/LytB domain-containing protein [Thermoleophilia bacterium]|nr:SpoIID/LytB domain-containing protein [Thermoleophilia bacterium]